MKKWFEFQESIQKNLQNETTSFIEQNIAHEMDYFNKWVYSNKENWKLKPCFGSDAYVDHILASYDHKDLDKDTLTEWIKDPEYNFIMRVSGREYEIKLNENEEKFKNILKPYFKIDWETASMEIFVQAPGQCFPLHYDIYKKNMFKIEEEKVHRYIIMLDDQKPGQVFLMGDQYIEWKKGDVIAWKQTTLLNGTANFGYWDRAKIRITARSL